MSRDSFKSTRVDPDSINFPDNVKDDPYGPERRCQHCNRRLNYKNQTGTCGSCRLNLTRPSSLSSAKINNENKKKKVYREDSQTATARLEISRRYGVSSEEVLDFAKRPRDNGFAFARCLLIYFLVEHLRKSYTEVAQVMKMGSPSTAENGYRRAKAIIELDIRAREVIAEVKEIVLKGIVLPNGLSQSF